MYRWLKHSLALPLSLALVALFAHGTALAQYQVTPLVTNATDSQLVNAWGIARSATSNFWVSDNVSGFSTLYDGSGNKNALVVTIPPAAGQAIGHPSGIVFNGGNDFVVSKNDLSGQARFIFATTDGTIAGWSPAVDLNNAVLMKDRSKDGAVYTGLAISQLSKTNFLYAADVVNNRVDVFNGKFQLVKSLKDSTIPAGFAPYGIQDIGGQVFVTYASVGDAPGGFVDIFSEAGVLQKRFTSDSHLNQPWGMALAPANFGAFSNALLVGNNLPGGQINAFDLKTGQFLGRLRDSSGKTIEIDQLWGLDFGGGTAANGNANQLFFTAGPGEYSGGTFGVIESLK
jgi:uncharacterized protein (TIGR03118 family)